MMLLKKRCNTIGLSVLHKTHDEDGNIIKG